MGEAVVVVVEARGEAMVVAGTGMRKARRRRTRGTFSASIARNTGTTPAGARRRRKVKKLITRRRRMLSQS